MLSHDQLAFAVTQRHPDLQPGKDFLTAHPIDLETDQQKGEARIVTWRPKDIPKPDIEILRETFVQHAAEWQVQEIHRERNARLAACDWTQLADTPESIRKPWAEYRKTLWDLTQQQRFPLSIEWPEPPAAG